MYKKVCVLFGGLSAEREISIKSSENVIAGLKEINCKSIIAIDAIDGFISLLIQHKPDVVFIALHGKYGEDGCVQGVLECMEIPYTHSGVLSCAQSMHKPTANFTLKNHKINVPDNFVFFSNSLKLPNINFDLPYILKPSNEGSSIGLTLVENQNQRMDASMIGREMMVEKFIEGRELTVGVLNGKALCVIEIEHKGMVFDFKKKYERSSEIDYIINPKIPKHIEDLAIQYAERSYDILCCRGIIRIDMIFNEKEGKLFVIEVNTHPGLSNSSIIPKMIKHCGIKFSEMLNFLLEDAFNK